MARVYLVASGELNAHKCFFFFLRDSTTFENEIINLVFDRALSSNKRRWARHVRPRRQTLGEWTANTRRPKEKRGRKKKKKSERPPLSRWRRSFGTSAQRASGVSFLFSAPFAKTMWTPPTWGHVKRNTHTRTVTSLGIPPDLLMSQ